MDEQGKYGYSIAFLSWETFSNKIMNLCKHKKLGDVKANGNVVSHLQILFFGVSDGRTDRSV